MLIRLVGRATQHCQSYIAARARGKEPNVLAANRTHLAFAHSANPKNWSLDMMQSMMKRHLDLTLAEAVGYVKGDYNGSVQFYEQVHPEILGMADTRSSGIVARFSNELPPY